jgi:hypothetical protein
VPVVAAVVDAVVLPALLVPVALAVVAQLRCLAHSSQWHHLVLLTVWYVLLVVLVELPALPLLLPMEPLELLVVQRPLPPVESACLLVVAVVEPVETQLALALTVALVAPRLYQGLLLLPQMEPLVVITTVLLLTTRLGPVPVVVQVAESIQATYKSSLGLVVTQLLERVALPVLRLAVLLDLISLLVILVPVVAVPLLVSVLPVVTAATSVVAVVVLVVLPALRHQARLQVPVVIHTPWSNGSKGLATRVVERKNKNGNRNRDY